VIDIDIVECAVADVNGFDSQRIFDTDTDPLLSPALSHSFHFLVSFAKVSFFLFYHAFRDRFIMLFLTHFFILSAHLPLTISSRLSSNWIDRSDACDHEVVDQL
jgi:hypothetical protein